MDNLRSAFGWSLETARPNSALRHGDVAVSRCGCRGAATSEGMACLETALGRMRMRQTVRPAIASAGPRGQVLPPQLAWAFVGSVDEAEQTLARAREIADPALVIRALDRARRRQRLPRRRSAARTSPRRPTLARKIGDSWLLEPGSTMGRSAHEFGLSVTLQRRFLPPQEGLAVGRVNRRPVHRSPLPIQRRMGASVARRPCTAR